MIFQLAISVLVVIFAGLQLRFQQQERDVWAIERQRLINLVISKDTVDFTRLQRASEIPAAQPEPQHPFVRREPAASQTDQDRVPPLPLGL